MEKLQSPRKILEDWRVDDFINKQYLCYDLRRCNTIPNHFILNYDINNYDWHAEQTSIKDNYENVIRLKTYLNKNTEPVDLVQRQSKIEFDIDITEEKLHFRLKYFFHRDADTEELSRNKAIVLETFTYEEFKNLVQYVGYGDFEKDTSYDYLGYFAKIYEFYFKQVSTPEQLIFLYTNTPDFVFERMMLDDEKVMQHLITLTEYDDTGFFSGWKDGSSALVNVFKASSPGYIMNRFRENPKLCNRIYYNLDGISYDDGKPQSNRLIFAGIIRGFAQNHKIKTDEPIFRISKGYRVNTKVTELSGKVLGLFGQSDSETFFLQQQEETTIEVQQSSSLGIPVNSTTVSAWKNSDDGRQYNPLEMVYLEEEFDGITTISKVPAIYVKALADTEKWERINETIRIAADIAAIILGIGTLATTGNPYLIMAALADLSLAIPDLTIQTFREEIRKLPGGEQFLKDWDLIYGVGGAIVAAPQLIISIYKGIFVMLPKAAKNVQQGLKASAISLFLDLNSGTFQRKDLRLFQQTEWVIPSGGFFSKTVECDALVQNGAFFMELDAANTLGQIEKGINPDIIGAISPSRKFALVYKGEIVAQGNRYDKAYQRTLMDLKRASYNAENVGNILETLWKRIARLSEDRKYWTCFNEAGTELRWANVTEKDVQKSINAALRSSNEGKLWEGEIAQELSQHEKITDFSNIVDEMQKGRKLNNAGDIDVGSSKYIIECKESVSHNTLTTRASDGTYKFINQFDKYLNPQNPKYINTQNRKVVLAIKTFGKNTNLSHPILKQLQSKGVIIITNVKQIKNLK